MSLMPTIIAAAARATLDGTPLVRRLDLEFPGAGVNAQRSVSAQTMLLEGASQSHATACLGV
jgi:hypothetical protein